MPVPILINWHVVLALQCSYWVVMWGMQSCGCDRAKCVKWLRRVVKGGGGALCRGRARIVGRSLRAMLCPSLFPRACVYLMHSSHLSLLMHMRTFLMRSAYLSFLMHLPSSYAVNVHHHRLHMRNIMLYTRASSYIVEVAVISFPFLCARHMFGMRNCKWHTCVRSLVAQTMHSI